jgi:hypothetical protein
MMRTDHRSGVCRRYPPAPAVVPWVQSGPVDPIKGPTQPFNQASTIWPPVADADYCGEFAAKTPLL